MVGCLVLAGCGTAGAANQAPPAPTAAATSPADRAALGIVYADPPGGSTEGVDVASVIDGGAAAAAGIRPDDLIVAVDGTRTPDTTALGAVLDRLRPGQRVPVTVRHPNRTTVTVNVVLAELPH